MFCDLHRIARSRKKKNFLSHSWQLYQNYSMCSKLHSGLKVKASLIFGNALVFSVLSFGVFVNEEMNEACYKR
jgi:hypothetical protein